MRVGIGVGKQTHTLVRFEKADGTLQVASKQYISNSADGLDELVQSLNGCGEVTFLGNHRWATPLACALQGREIKCTYFPLTTERGKRGRTGDVGEMLRKRLISGIAPRPFFAARKDRDVKVEPELPTSYRIGLEYLDAANRVRILKHQILDCLGVLFPEAVRAGTTTKKPREGEEIKLPVPQPQPPDLWTKKMRSVLQNPDPFSLAESSDTPPEIRQLAAKSLGRYVPAELRQKSAADLAKFLREYDDHVVLKDRKLGSVHDAASTHPLYELFEAGDVIAVLVCFLGSEPWKADWFGWRALRSFCGLNVTRLDAAGNPHISRVRGEIRQYLYLLATLTKRGKEISRKPEWKSPEERWRKCKRLEVMLYYLFCNGLAEEPVKVGMQQLWWQSKGKKEKVTSAGK